MDNKVRVSAFKWALLAVGLVATPATLFSDDILVLTHEGAFVVPVNGRPGQSLAIEQWWQGDVVDQRGNAPESDKIADQVEKWADQAVQLHRGTFQATWERHIESVRQKTYTPAEIATKRMKPENERALDTIIVKDEKAGWIFFCEQVAEMLADEFRRTGGYSLKTFVSIHKGLARG